MHGRLNKIKKRLKMYWSKRQLALGIHLTSTTVHLLAISCHDGALTIEKYGCEALPVNAINGYLIKDISVIAYHIKNLISQLQVNDKNVAIAIPDALISRHVIQIPAGLRDSEIEELINSQADQYIPYSLDEISFDFEILGYSPKDSSCLNVLLVISRKENVSNRVAAIVQSGLNPVVVEVESHAMERAAQHIIQCLSTDIKTFAVLEVEKNEIRLLVLHYGSLIYSHDEKYSTNQEMGLDTEKILSSLQLLLHFFYLEHIDKLIDHIVLTGNLAKLPDFRNLIQQRVNITTTIANPFTQMGVNEEMNRPLFEKAAPALMVACGLALRGIR